MYIVKSHNDKNHKVVNSVNFVNIDGFMMPSKNNCFMINSERIKDIKIVDRKLILNVINKKVTKKYQRLVRELTDLLIEDSDDESGAMRQILDKIEKFRQEIKFKYRSYMKKKDLELMAKQLRMFQSEAKKRFLEVNTYNYTNSKGRNR